MAPRISYLEFEKPVADLDGKVIELRRMAETDESVDVTAEIAQLEVKSQKALADLYEKLTPWHKAQVARHPERPHAKAYVDALITDFVPLAGDRNFAEDYAVLTGMGRFDGQPVVVLGHEKGHDTQSRLHHNFGMARPEGYRKAVRLMDMADNYDMPVLSFVDTPGAYPGVGAEERGQAEAIARSTQRCLNLTVPMISLIIGEGGSGGAIAIATANRVLMMQHAIYSVISPEGAASILWRDATRAQDAATAMKITAQDLMELGVLDEIVPEPLGGAHRDRPAAFAEARASIRKALDEMSTMNADELKKQRQDKFLAMGRI
ncbi:MAG: acetyl-CoA carboxylase carboxyltransferase subunit alpha [Pseudomonadota bacterium]